MNKLSNLRGKTTKQTEKEIDGQISNLKNEWDRRTMIEIIDNAINQVQTMFTKPTLINLSDKDYERLGKDCGDEYIKKLEFYKSVNGIEVGIYCKLNNEDEVSNPLLAQSFICSPHVLIKGDILKPIEWKQVGRRFNLRTLEEIL